MHQFAEDAVKGDPVALTRLLIATPSVNPVLESGGDGEARIAAITAEILESWGFDVSVTEPLPGRPNVVGRLAGEGPTLLLNGHLDTVGVSGMTIDPFDPVVDGGRLYGRGSCDMKAGVAALLAAAHRLSASGPRPELVVALTSDEEHASVGMADLVLKPTAVADYAIVCEPTSLKVMPAHKGFVWIRALFRGVAAHGSRPDIGIDAIRHAGLFLAALDAFDAELRARPEHPLLGHGSLHAGTISGGSVESVYPDRCTLDLERRTLPGESPDDVLAEFQAVLRRLAAVPGLDAELAVTLERPGTEVPVEHELVQGILDAGAHLGVERSVEGMTAWVDAAFLNEAGIPAVCYGPGSIEQAHTDDEWVDVTQISTCAAVLERYARGLATSN